MSVNKLGGLALVIGPIVALASFLIRPGGGLIGGQVDPADGMASIQVIMANGTMSTLSGAGALLGLMVFLYGVNVVVDSLKGGNGEALARLGALFLIFGLVTWLIGTSAQLVIASGSIDPTSQMGVLGTLYAESLGLGNIGSVLTALAFLCISWAVSTRDDFNRKFAIVVAALSAVLVVVSVMAALNSSMLQTAGMVASVVYLVTVAWSVTIGLNYSKKG
jgi:hypothetical protein